MEIKEVKSDKDIKCPECGSPNYWTDHDAGEAGCSNCGTVFSDDYTRMVIGINRGRDWKAYTTQEEDARRHVGSPTSYSVHDKGLLTFIGFDRRDHAGCKIPLKNKPMIWKLRKWQNRTRAYKAHDKNLAQAMSELDRLADKLYIPGPVKEKAAVIYRKSLEKRLTQGRSITAIADASMYAACRNSETPRTLSEIAKVSLVDKKDISRSYRLLLRELDIKQPIADPISYVPKIAESVGISEQTQGVAIKLIIDAKKKRAQMSKDPRGLAGAALYIAGLQTGEKKIQKDISDAAGVTEVTIRNRQRELKRLLGLGLPENNS